jgi:hypothetical protein
LTDEITLLQTRINGMLTGKGCTKAELQLRAKIRERETLLDEQLMAQGARTVLRRQRKLDTAPRELAGLQDCLALGQSSPHRPVLPPGSCRVGIRYRSVFTTYSDPETALGRHMGAKAKPRAEVSEKSRKRSHEGLFFCYI